MMKKNKLLELPFSSTSLLEEPLLRTSDSDLLLLLKFDNNEQVHTSEIRFTKRRAFRAIAEIYCTPWHVEAYDVLSEIENSNWVSELRSASQPEWRDRWIMKHFIIYIDSFGCLEVVAEAAKIS